MTIAANRPVKKARRSAGIGRALGWWLGELRACRDAVARWSAMRGRGITIEAGERYWMLRQGQHPVSQLDRQADTSLSAALRRLIPAARPVIVEIPPERTLAKVVEFPADARRWLDRIVEFEIARHFPFPAERVYYRHRIVERHAATGMLAIEIVAVPRDIVDEICAALAAAGLRPVAIAALSGGGEPQFLPLPARPVQPLSLGTRVLSVAAILAALGAAVSWPLAQQARLAAIERELAALQPQAQAALRADEARRHTADRSAAILRLRGGRPPLVAVLDRLSRDVPDGSWLLSLSIGGRELVIDGLAPSAASIALALEKSGDAIGITFRSPIAREPTTGLEHFQLGATLTEEKP